MDILLKMAATLAVILAVLSVFSSLTWLMRLRIIAAVAVGMLLVGLAAWRGVQPVGPDGIVTFPALGGAIVLCILALVAGFIGYFVSWPYGEKIAVLTVPVGLATWSLRSSNIATLMQKTADAAQRHQALVQFKWTAFLWLIPIVAGFAGILLGQLIAKGQTSLLSKKSVKDLKLGDYANILTALIGSGLIALFCVKILAQDIRFSDIKLNSVVAQPSSGQIFFAVVASFAIAAFIVNMFLNFSYIWPILATVAMPAFCISFYAKAETVAYLAENFPAVFFAHPAVAILPIQVVSYGTLGAIAGHWIAQVYKIWRKQQAQ
ncbi:MAG: hypothetical protein PVG93_02505 [Phycisphaerales bacterium]|jgi:hypothetical protein